MSFEQKTLIGKNIILIPFEDSHIEDLKLIAINENIWQYLPTKIHTQKDFEEYIALIKSHIKKRIQYVYTIKDVNSGKVLGATHFFNIDARNKKLEIGNSWLTPQAWGTKTNIEAKYLLLGFCFEIADIQRVELRTRETNMRSQKAIEKTGGVREGILRNDRINEDGSFRNTILYSIIQPDWPDLKLKLEKTLS